MLGKRLVMLAATAAVCVGSAGSFAPAAQAEERTCRGTIGAKTLDNVRVPQGATCYLTKTYVKGTVTVARDARLFADSVRVVGNIQGENAKNVVVKSGSRVGGSVQVEQGRAATVRGSRVNGDVQYSANRAYLRVLGNDVGGSVQVIGNSGGAEIYRNTIDGNLQCKENTPRPTGGGNVVGGNKEDQCARF